MKKWLLALVLIAMLLTLYSCGNETPADSAAETSTGAAAEQTAEPAAAVTSAESDINKTEFVIYEDRILFIAKTSADVQKQFADAANAFFRSLPDVIHRYLMIAPMRIAFEVPELQALSSDQKAEIQSIYKSMDPSVTLVDAYYALEQHADNLNDIYYRTDHHWTHLGSYYAAQAFFEAAGIAYHTIDEYERMDGGTFLGYLQDLADDPYFYDKPDTLHYYLLPGVNRETWVYYKNVETGELEKTVTTLVDVNRSGYEKFIGKNGFSHAIIFGDQTSDRALLLTGNSYTFSITTWFADSFKTVVLIDPRYFEGGKEGIAALIDTYGITDALILTSTSDSAALTVNFSYDIQLLAQ